MLFQNGKPYTYTSIEDTYQAIFKTFHLIFIKRKAKEIHVLCMIRVHMIQVHVFTFKLCQKIRLYGNL